MLLCYLSKFSKETAVFPVHYRREIKITFTAINYLDHVDKYLNSRGNQTGLQTKGGEVDVDSFHLEPALSQALKSAVFTLYLNLPAFVFFLLKEKKVAVFEMIFCSPLSLSQDHC